MKYNSVRMRADAFDCALHACAVVGRDGDVDVDARIKAESLKLFIILSILYEQQVQVKHILVDE